MKEDSQSSYNFIWQLNLSKAEKNKILLLLAKQLKVKVKVVSDCLRPHGLYSPWNSSGQNIGVGSLSLLQGIFLTQESNQSLLHCRQILYQLSYQGNPS